MTTNKQLWTELKTFTHTYCTLKVLFSIMNTVKVLLNDLVLIPVLLDLQLAGRLSLHDSGGMERKSKKFRGKNRQKWSLVSPSRCSKSNSTCRNVSLFSNTFFGVSSKIWKQINKMTKTHVAYETFIKFITCDRERGKRFSRNPFLFLSQNICHLVRKYEDGINENSFLKLGDPIPYS